MGEYSQNIKAEFIAICFCTAVLALIVLGFVGCGIWGAYELSCIIRDWLIV